MKNRRLLNLVPVLLVLLVLAASMSFLIYTKVSQYMGLYISILQEKAELEEDRIKLARLRELGREEASVADYVNSRRSLIPDEPEEAALIDYIQELAREANADFVQIKFDPRAEKDGYSEMPLSITFDGKYPDFISFIQKIRNGQRAVRIDGIYAGMSESGGNTIRAELAAKAFYREGT